MGFKEAQHYKKLGEKKVHCVLCPHSCIFDNGEVGKCYARMNIDGSLKSLVFAKPHITNYSFVEANSLYHFLPGKETLNLATPGTNLGGKFYGEIVDIEEIPTLDQHPGQIIEQIKKTNSKIISYVGEPTIFYEYVDEIIGKSEKLKNVIVTNGFIEKEAVREIAKKVDGFVFDIRSMTDEFYEKICGGKLEPVLKAVKTAYNCDKWIEIKMTLIPALHSSFYDVRKLVSFILRELSSDVPLHFLSFEPNEQTVNYPITDPEIIKKARKIALDAGMNYVYTDNIDFEEGKTTFCPTCKKPVVIREKNNIEILLKDGKCSCGKEIPGVWQ